MAVARKLVVEQVSVVAEETLVSTSTA